MLLLRIGSNTELTKHCQLAVLLEPWSKGQMIRSVLNFVDFVDCGIEHYKPISIKGNAGSFPDKH